MYQGVRGRPHVVPTSNAPGGKFVRQLEDWVQANSNKVQTLSKWSNPSRAQRCGAFDDDDWRCITTARDRRPHLRFL